MFDSNHDKTEYSVLFNISFIRQGYKRIAIGEAFSAWKESSPIFWLSNCLHVTFGHTEF